MASKLHFVIASTFVIALIQNAQAVADQCTTTPQNGTLKGSVIIELPRIYLDSSSRDWTVIITKPKNCGTENGVFAVTCDAQEAPMTYFQDMSHLFVHRNSDLSEKATVDVTLYCN